MRLRRWLAARTLRGRLIAGLVTLLALACACVGLVTYLVLNHTLITQLDNQLFAARGRYVACIEGIDPPPPRDSDNGPPGRVTQNCNTLQGQAAGTFGARLKNGHLTIQGIVKGPSHLSPEDKAALARLPDNGGYYTLDLKSIGGDYRLTATEGQDGDVIVTGLAFCRRQPVVATDRLQIQGVVPTVVRQPGQCGLVLRREVGVPLDDALNGEVTVLQPRPERARCLALESIAILCHSAGRTIVGVSRRRRVYSLYAGDVTSSRGEQLIVELGDQGVVQDQVGDEADAGAGQREQRDEAGDEPAAQGTRGKPAAQPHRPPPAASQLLISCPASARTRPRAPCGSAARGRRRSSCAGS